MIAEIQNTITAAPGRCGFQLNEDHPINQASTFAPGRCGFQPHRIQSKPVGAVFNRTGLECPINSKIHYRKYG